MSTAVIPSPVGDLTLTGHDDVLTGVYLPETHRRADADLSGAHIESADPFESGVLAEAARQLDAYFAGRLRSFDLPIAVDTGTVFQRRVWEALREIGYGRTVSYRELASAIGQPSACRAVGMANGRNPLSIVVPCHRVIGADGSLTGYGGGLPAKRALLALEVRTTHPAGR